MSDILYIHDGRDFRVKEKGKWVEGAKYPGLTIYNDPIEIIFRKNQSESRKDLVITQDAQGNWVARFYKDDRLIKSIEL